MEVCPSPKSHDQLVGFPVERSVNVTDNEAQPSVTDALKSAFSCEKEVVLTLKKKIKHNKAL